MIGSPCGYHGPYTFYKGIRISPIDRESNESNQNYINECGTIKNEIEANEIATTASTTSSSSIVSASATATPQTNTSNECIKNEMNSEINVKTSYGT